MGPAPARKMVAPRICQLRLNSDPGGPGWFLGPVATLLDSGGCVDIDFSGEEGSWPPAAIGQAGPVHGAAGQGWSVCCCGPGRGCLADHGANWSRGYKIYRRGVVVGFVDALDRLEVLQISGRYLSADERILIADLRQHEMSIRQIAAQIGRAPSTVSRARPGVTRGGPGLDASRRRQGYAGRDRVDRGRSRRAGRQGHGPGRRASMSGDRAAAPRPRATMSRQPRKSPSRLAGGRCSCD